MCAYIVRRFNYADALLMFGAKIRRKVEIVP